MEMDNKKEREDTVKTVRPSGTYSEVEWHSHLTWRGVLLWFWISAMAAPTAPSIGTIENGKCLLLRSRNTGAMLTKGFAALIWYY
jgi:hypothetical protein